MASKTTPKHTRKTHWTDDEKRALFAAFDAATAAGKTRVQWFKEHGISGPHFYRMRKAFSLGEPQPAQAQPAQAQPATPKKHRISPEGLAKIIAAQKRRWAASKKKKKGTFAAASNEEKRRLLIEYDSLPEKTGSKGAWLAAHGISETERSGLMTYYRNKFRKEGRHSAAAPSTALTVHSNGDRASRETQIVTAYANLPATVKKIDWLKERGLSYALMHDMRKRVAYHSQSVVPHAAFSQVLPTTAPGPVVTLEDAIAAEQVRIDITLEVLDRFRRMMRSGR